MSLTSRRSTPAVSRPSETSTALLRARIPERRSASVPAVAGSPAGTKRDKAAETAAASCACSRSSYPDRVPSGISSRNSSPAGQAESARPDVRPVPDIRAVSPRIRRIRRPVVLPAAELVGTAPRTCGEIDAVMKRPRRTNTPPTIVVWYTVWEIGGSNQIDPARRAACHA